MKKSIQMVLVAAIGLLLASCEVQKDLPPANRLPARDSLATYSPRTVSSYGKDVEGIQGKLVSHPDSNSLKGKDGNDYYLLYDLSKKCLYVTVHRNVYMDILNWLPVKRITGHSVSIEAPIINPLTLFTGDQLAEESKKTGLALNEFKMGKIYNYNLEEGEIPASSKNVNNNQSPPPDNQKKPSGNGRSVYHPN